MKKIIGIIFVVMLLSGCSAPMHFLKNGCPNPQCDRDLFECEMISEGSFQQGLAAQGDGLYRPNTGAQGFGNATTDLGVTMMHRDRAKSIMVRCMQSRGYSLAE